MPWSRPTLSELIAMGAADVASAKPGADALLRFGDLNVIVKSVQGLAFLHYGYQDWIAKQCTPFTAEGEFLEAWAAIKNVFRKAATVWLGTVSFTGCTPTTPIPANTPLVRGDGATYVSTADAEVAGDGTVTFPVTAQVAGSTSNSDIGVVLTLGVSIAGMQTDGNVAAITTEGTNVETDDSLRGRMLAAFQDPPQGGAAGDYPEWATQINSVTRAWVQPNGLGAGTVVVFFMMDEAESAFGGFPQGTNGVATAETRAYTKATGDQLIVANYLYPLQPVTAAVFATAPADNPIDFTISGISGVSAPTKAAIAAAMADVFFRKASPGDVYLPDGGIAGEVDLDEFYTAIASVAGTGGFVIEVPAGNITSGSGELPTLGNITYVP